MMPRPAVFLDAHVSPGQRHLVYTRPIGITDVTYIVEWKPGTCKAGAASASAPEQVIGTSGGLQTIRASVTLPGGEYEVLHAPARVEVRPLLLCVHLLHLLEEPLQAQQPTVLEQLLKLRHLIVQRMSNT